MGNRLNNPSNLAAVMAADAAREGVHVLGQAAPAAAADLAAPAAPRPRPKRKAKAKRGRKAKR